MNRCRLTSVRLRACCRHGRSGFSLLELMVAIVILGLGLIMVATMYPVAWSRARDLSEFTSHVSIVEAAHTTINALTRANDGSSTPLPLPGSFAGDWIYDPDPGLPEKHIAAPNTRVHPLYLENVTAAAPRRFVPDRLAPWKDPLQPEPEYPPWSLAWVEVDPTYSVALDGLCDASGFEHRCDNLFLSSQVQFESRVYPPIRPRADTSLQGGGIFSTTVDDLEWDEALDTARFAWAAFHRLVEPAFTPPSSDWIAERLYEHDRVFEMYYVTLRRPQSTLRYTRQDPDHTKIPDPAQRELVVTPAALCADMDVLLPEPWRVQVYFPVDQIKLAADGTGIPTEIEVNTTNAATAEFVVDMFQVGTQFIDEQNGAIYRVVKRRLTGANLEKAHLTLDREVVIEDLDDGPAPDYGDGKLDFVVDKVETLRAVWVFPPAVEAARTSTGAPIFVGKQPVIDIATRQLKLPAG